MGEIVMTIVVEKCRNGAKPVTKKDCPYGPVCSVGFFVGHFTA